LVGSLTITKKTQDDTTAFSIFDFNVKEDPVGDLVEVTVIIKIQIQIKNKAIEREERDRVSETMYLRFTG